MGKPVSFDDLIKSSTIKFIENKGQVRDENGNVRSDVRFVARVDFGLVIVKDNEISFAFVKPDPQIYERLKPEDPRKQESPLGGIIEPKVWGDEKAKIDIYRVDMLFNNALSKPRIVAKEMSIDYDNFYNVPNNPDGILFVRSYKTLVLENIYPNIDFVLYGNNENKFQYDFVIKKGADPDRISFTFKGAEKIEVTPEGSLKVFTPLGTIEQGAPVSYQLPNLNDYTNSREILADARMVESRFVKLSDNTIGFKVENYDASKPLIIDPPTRLWGTYYGGSSTDIGYATFADVNGNSYITGYTYSTNNIATSGAHQTSLSTTPDAFLVKFNSDGVRQWGTYYGGSSSDYGYAVTADANGYVYITGYTYSSNNIATSNGHQPTLSTTPDGFLVQFNSSGVRQWGTYYGGTSTDIVYAACSDNSGNVYITGYTYSTTNIATSNGHQPSISTTPDAFLVKFNTSGVRQWGTYYGGTSTDYGWGCGCDGDNNVFLGGYTYSSNNIATSNGFQTTLNTTPDGFLVKFNSSGVRQWGTYYGGNSTDIGYGVAADANGNSYLCGYTYSTNNIASSNAHQTSLGGYMDAFVVKFNSDGSRAWGTYYGGTDYDYGYGGVAADPNGNVYLSGYTYSYNNIATSDAYQSSMYTPYDGFLVMFNSNGQRKWGTYYGGNSSEYLNYGNNMWVDGQGNPFIGGYTYSTDRIASSNGHQPSASSTPEAFLVKFEGEIIRNDAGITDITSPVEKFDSYQPQPVRVRLKNFSPKLRLYSVTINWSVNGVVQTPYYWSGDLDTGATTIVELVSDYTFTPAPPWGPFVIRAWTTDPQGPDANANRMPDGNPANDAFTRSINPIYNDAGFLNADGMIPLNPGINPVVLRIKNYAPKPLTSVFINYSINGVNQQPYYWTGYLASQDSIDVVVGEYDFGTANLPFTIKGWTTWPNGYPDENPSNDENTVTVYKALAGGTYYIGGRNPDFQSIDDFVSYISYWGIAGPVTISLRPGTYTAGVLLEPRGVKQFPLTFQSSTGRAEDVIITNGTENYVFKFDRYNKISFKNVTLKTNNCINGNVVIFTGGNNSANFEGCIVEGCQNPSRTTNFALILSDNNILNDLTITNTIFRYGSAGIYHVTPTGQFSSNHTITGNTFIGQNWQAIHSENVQNCNIADNNISGVNMYWGIYAVNCSNITGNRVSGVGPATSTAISNDNAAITVVHTGGVTDPTNISNNVVMTTNASGVYLSGISNLNLSSNQISPSATGSYDKAGVVIYNSALSNQSLISNNTIIGSSTAGVYFFNVQNPKIYKNYIKLNGGDKYAFNINNSSNLIFGNNLVTGLNAGSLSMTFVNDSKFFYNTFVNNASISDIYLNSLGDGNVFKRNNIVNKGTGYAIQYTGVVPMSLTSDENNIYTNGTNLANFLGMNLSNLGEWIWATGLDQHSVSILPVFISDDNPRVIKIDPALYFKYPLPDLAGPLHEEIEANDLDGNPRNRTYYIGVNTLNPKITIVSQPNDVVNCVGSVNNYFSVVAEIDFGGELYYQWYKNDVPIDGATDAILWLPPLQNEDAGVFKCMISGNGEADPVWTNSVLLYAVEPTKITRQPEQVYVNLGSVAKFEIDVHVNGSDNPLFQPEVQWYRGNVKLNDNDRIAGSKSSILTIRDVRAIDLGDDYYVVVKGLCGTDTSKPISLVEKPRIVAQPLADQQVCEGDDVQFTVNASSTVPGFTLAYQWKFNGSPLTDGGKYSGANTATLTITDVSVAEAGQYSVEITIEGFDQVEVGPANLAVFTKPVIVTDLPQTVDIETGKDLTLTVTATGTSLSYQWYKDGQEIPYTESTLQITGVTTDDAGTYKVKVFNQCGEVWSSECVVNVTFKTILNKEDGINGIQLFQNVPNPFDNRTKIEFNLSEGARVRLLITNSMGEVIASFQRSCDSGLNAIEINAKDLGLTPGAYFYILEVNGVRLNKQMLFIH